MKKICLLLLTSLTLHSAELKLEKEELTRIGMQVWHNECRGTLDGLISWNEGESFPSLGIGHFIWHPQGAQKQFEETFPRLIEFFKEREIAIPSWIDPEKGCPWKDRVAFATAKRSKKLRELRELLSTTLDLQILFIYEQFQLAEKKLLPLLSEKEIAYLEKLKETPQGVYALIDYVHFKGTGLSAKERYRGEGWGLLQVLQTMAKSPEESSIVLAFTTSAKKVLAKRVRNAADSHKEGRWLKGWYKRVETYTSKAGVLNFVTDP